MGRPCHFMKLAPGYVLIRLAEKNTVKDGIAMADRKNYTPVTGTVEQVGNEDFFGKPLWEVGDKVFAPTVAGSDIEIDGIKFRVVHHLRILMSL